MARDDRNRRDDNKPTPAQPGPARSTPAPAPAPAATPTPAPARASEPARASAPARVSAVDPGVGQTATRPIEARTPTSPPRRADAPRQTGSDAADVSGTRDRNLGPASRAAPRPGGAGGHYARPVDVPLRPGQTIGYTAGKGYYATTRPNPTRASRPSFRRRFRFRACRSKTVAVTLPSRSITKRCLPCQSVR